jgi:Acetyltransferase (GNAT) domain
MTNGAHARDRATHTAPMVEVRPLTPGDDEPWAALLAACFDREPAQMTALLGWFRAGFTLVSMGAWDGEELVAQYNARLLDLSVSGIEGPVPAAMGLNMAVAAHHRGRGLLDTVATPVHQALAAMGCVAGVGFSGAGGLAVTRASRHYSYEVLGAMSPLAVAVARRRYPPALDLRETWPTAPIELPLPDDGFVRYGYTPASLRHRFAEHPFRHYAYAVRERGGMVDGLVVYRETRLRGLPAVSLLAAYGSERTELLGGFAAALRSRGRHVLHVVLSPGSPVRQELAAIGPAVRVPVSHNPYHLITRALQPDTPPVLFDLARWDCMGGDIL